MTNIGTGSVSPGASPPESIMQQTEAAQLSKLSSVLNGLEGGAVLMRRHILDAMRAVRSGTYQVDAVKLSRRIVGEALGSN
ncbi:MAG: hypothetical protein JO022_11710 [Acidobacteriaceae bacterium]|nr:hypothetical protein [Acidobacteriaceae bacterium]